MCKENEAPKSMSYMAWVIALTKSFTAFACLQSATQKRVLESQDMKVVWDCIVVNRSLSDNNNNNNNISKKPKSVGDTLAGLAAVLESYRHANISSNSSTTSSSNQINSPVNRSIKDKGNYHHSIVKKKTGNLLSSREYKSRNLSNDERKQLISTLTNLINQNNLQLNEHHQLDQQQHTCDCTNNNHYNKSNLNKIRWELITENEESIVTTETHNYLFPYIKSEPQTPKGENEEKSNENVFIPSRFSTSSLPSLNSSSLYDNNQSSSIISQSYTDALLNPKESKDRLQNVLRTVTTTLTQKQIKRRIEITKSSSSSSSILRKSSTPDFLGSNNKQKYYIPNLKNNKVKLNFNNQRFNFDEQPLAPPSSPICIKEHFISNHNIKTLETPKDMVEETTKGIYWPREHLIKNIHRFMRYSSAAYGKSFMRILGIGSCDWNNIPTNDHHANHHAFAYHNNIPIDAILLSSYTDPPSAFNSNDNNKICPLVHYVAVDHAAKSIVLTCRGTLGFQDVLVDLTCDYERIEINGVDNTKNYFAIHQGMLNSARRLSSQSNTVLSTVRKALIDYPNYGLILCGHSLGGGAVAALSILLGENSQQFEIQSKEKGINFNKNLSTSFVTGYNSGLPPGRNLSCYTYGTPCVTTADLTNYTNGLIISVVNNNDIVPTLSLGLLRDLRKLTMLFKEEGNIADEIIGRVLGIGYNSNINLNKVNDKLRQNDENFISREEIKLGHTYNAILNPGYVDPAISKAKNLNNNDDDLNDWLWSLKTTIRADMDNIKLYPPGEVFIVERSTCYVSLAHDNDNVNNDNDIDDDDNDDSNENNYTFKQEAHRVILRYCQDVEKRFNEPFFSKSMFTDHSPVEYERATQLLFDGITTNT